MPASISTYEAQALRPRGANIREKIQFLISWYEKTINIEMQTSSAYRQKFFAAQSDAAQLMRSMLEIESDDDLRAKVKDTINLCNDDVNHQSVWTSSYDSKMYFKIELQRVLD